MWRWLTSEVSVNLVVYKSKTTNSSAFMFHYPYLLVGKSLLAAGTVPQFAVFCHHMHHACHLPRKRHMTPQSAAFCTSCPKIPSPFP